MFPLTRVPFWYRFFEPHPSKWKYPQNVSSKHQALLRWILLGRLSLLVPSLERGALMGVPVISLPYPKHNPRPSDFPPLTIPNPEIQQGEEQKLGFPFCSAKSC